MEGGSRKKWKRGRAKGGCSLCGPLLAPQESLWAGKEGRMSWLRGQGVCPEDTTLHQPTPHWLLPELASGWALDALFTDGSASLLGFRGLDIKAQLPKPPTHVPPHAVFKLLNVQRLCHPVQFPLPSPQDRSGPAPPQPARESLGTSVGVRNCTLPFQIRLYVRPLQTPLSSTHLSWGGLALIIPFTLDTAVAS